MAEKEPININRLIRNIITIATIGLILFLLWYFKLVTIFIMSGVVLSLIARPLYQQLERIHIGKVKIHGAINALASIFLVWIILGAIGALVIPIVIKEATKVSKVDPEKLLKQAEKPINNTIYQMEMLGLIDFSEADTMMKRQTQIIERTIVYKLPCDSIYNLSMGTTRFFTPDADTLVTVYKNVPVPVKDTSVHGIMHRKELEHMVKQFWFNHVNIQEVGGFFSSAFGILGNILATIVSASFMAFFFLRDRNLFKNMVLTLVPQKYEKQATEIMTQSRKTLSRYFIGLVVEMMLVMVCTTIGMLIIGIRFELAVTIGFFGGLFNMVPYLGPIIGGVVGIFIGCANYIEMDLYAQLLPLVGKMALVCAIVQVLDNNIFQTVIFSNSVNAHPIEIFIVIVVAGSLSGVVGMIFAVPVYSVVRIIARQFFSNFKLVRNLTKNM